MMRTASNSFTIRHTIAPTLRSGEVREVSGRGRSIDHLGKKERPGDFFEAFGQPLQVFFGALLQRCGILDAQFFENSPHFVSSGKQLIARLREDFPYFEHV